MPFSLCVTLIVSRCSVFFLTCFIYLSFISAFGLSKYEYLKRKADHRKKHHEKVVECRSLRMPRLTSANNVWWKTEIGLNHRKNTNTIFASNYFSYTTCKKMNSHVIQNWLGFCSLDITILSSWFLDFNNAFLLCKLPFARYFQCKILIFYIRNKKHV